MATGHKRNTTIRDRHRAVIRARRGPCGICQGEIDYALRTPDPDSFEVDHIVALINGGTDTIDNKQASHRRCNRAKSDRLAGAVDEPAEAVTTGRAWWNEGETA